MGTGNRKGEFEMGKKVFCLIVMAMILCWPHVRADAELSSADKDFLVQCQVSEEDIEMIPKLMQEVQNELSALIATRDCMKIAPFKNTRDYYGQLKPRTNLPRRKPFKFVGDYLTDDEWAHYQDLLKVSPWAQEE
jgi:hypothetical protein